MRDGHVGRKIMQCKLISFLSEVELAVQICNSRDFSVELDLQKSFIDYYTY